MTGSEGTYFPTEEKEVGRRGKKERAVPKNRRKGVYVRISATKGHGKGGVFQRLYRAAPSPWEKGRAIRKKRGVKKTASPRSPSWNGQEENDRKRSAG